MAKPECQLLIFPFLTLVRTPEKNCGKSISKVRKYGHLRLFICGILATFFLNLRKYGKMLRNCGVFPISHLDFLGKKRACKLKPPAKFFYEATRFFIAEKLLSFFLFTAIRRSSTQLKISLNPNLLSIQALYYT
jgi:hypothetical protein